jgi:hypothetical protein|eukprot:TRINITY_DN69504_c0_g1_i1.p1 TRINITY_DN69504_c0_g1~~TRINITY_DN69504_c0_g1_i1.p1  ORF type:complete len:330 (-),score=71.24 TRINITY_DN69504_c0_g1_i1:51-1040(-)
MKRRNVRAVCAAAASDDEDLGCLFSAESSARKVLRRDATTEVDGRENAVVSEPAGRGSGKKQSKAKEFAWMDSEDEDDDKKKSKDSGENRGGDASDEERDAEDAEISEEALDVVQSFGRMMLLAPALRKRLRSGEACSGDVVAATCRALARTKFFDKDILEDLYATLRKLAKDNLLDVSQANDVLMSLTALNAYDASVYAAIASSFRSKTSMMDPGVRASWLEVFRMFAQDQNKGFQQLLEAPPLATTNPGFRKVRCTHYSKGVCVLGSECSWSHDPHAPLFLDGGIHEDWWRSKPLVMTQNQRTLGRGVYGGGVAGGAASINGFVISQ